MQRFSGPAAPPLLHSGFGTDQLLQLAAFEHLHHDVGPADELAFDVELWNRRPVGIFLDASADLGVLKDVHRFIADAETVDVLQDPEIRQGIKEFSDWPTIPQLYVKGEFVGGSDIMMEMFESGELQQLLEAA